MRRTVRKEALGAGGHPCRAVTAEEVAHYQEFGWVKLEGFVRAETVKLVLDGALQRMGEDADSNALIETLAPGVEKKIAYFNAEYGGGLENPPVRSLIEHVGSNAKPLMSRSRPVGVRYFSDFYAPKLPSSRQARHGGNGPTSFHQDFINFSVDRSGGMTFWVALEDYGPEFGTMSFVSGSHRLGVLGNYRTYQKGEDLLDIYPNLREHLEISEPMSYAAGDVTVHSHMTVHGAGANLTNRPRWAYLMLVQPADACWTGAPAEAFDAAGMEINKPLPEDRFPTLA
ncbi:MAG TPA: phytanoyl-CoA dioxygenase family protein [Steroidobacteraceae bacterium]|nr:phytanoyl-CoA dioxygenase family protein [Steroidobacteraceae bacterium]